ncbi:acyl-coenzyme A thioesterase 5 [Hyalella azteca]|uniref:Acyl-coenzyme A thioesterase 5 n=1 Tax=Hyalella azteca TaxID=294128 RepID=A0A8B7PLJ8_HYAAZ|nr:acyl-coenzyme A thioesterase 5 [Hyalella azteca]
MLPSPTMLNIVKSCCRNGQYALVPKSWYYNSKLLQKCSMSSSACITVSPPACQLDDPVNITISGLKKHKIYTLHTSLTDQKGVPFTSVAHYRSDEHGIIDLDKTPSRGGHFASLYPMGPFISMVQQGPSGQHARIHLTDMYSPLNYQLEVYPDAVGYQLMQKGKSLGLKPICSTQHTRRLMGKGCTSIPVRHGRIRGTLHLPPGESEIWSL